MPYKVGKGLESKAEEMHFTRRRVNRISEIIGERGGEQVLARNGYHVPEAFRSTGLDGARTGARRIDALGISEERDSIIVPEYKGVSGRVDSTLRATRLEGRASQGQPPYLRDRMLSDSRVIQLLHDDSVLWERVKSGDVKLYTQVITTKGPGQVQQSDLLEFSIKAEAPGVDENAVINAIEGAIKAVSSG